MQRRDPWRVLTGNLEMIETLDEGLYLILCEAMEELLEEHGYDLDEIEPIPEDDD